MWALGGSKRHASVASGEISRFSRVARKIFKGFQRFSRVSAKKKFKAFQTLPWGKWGFFSGQRQIFASQIFIHRGKFSRDFRKHGRAVPAPRTGRFSKICPPLPSFGPQAGSSPCQATRPPCCAGWATGCSPCLHARRSTRCSPSATRSATTSPA